MKIRFYFHKKVYPKVKTLKGFLENNKVFFELFSMIVISGAAVWVAIQANSISNRTNEIADLQVKMTRSENMPLFSSKIDRKEEGLYEDGRSIDYQHLLYTITNSGGRILDVYSNIERYLEVSIINQEDNGPHYDDNGNLIGPSLVYRLSIEDYFTKPYSYYDYSSDTLTFRSNMYESNTLIFDLRQELNPDLTGKILTIQDISHLRIYYTDIYGAYHVEQYDVTDSGMKKINMQTYSKTLLVQGSMQIDDADVIAIAEDIRNVFGINVPTKR